MGIRYYAYPIRAEDILRAQHEPRAYLSDDPLADAWGQADARPPMLYLDKCWAELQSVFWPQSELQPRPAFDLVAGRVTHTSEGWIPYTRVLSPEQVETIASDLTQVDGTVVTSALGLDLSKLDNASALGEYDYTMQYLAAARDFLEELCAHGLGLVYMIG